MSAALYKKHLKIFKKLNPNLAAYISSAKEENYLLCPSEDGSLNVKKKGAAEDFYFHSIQSPILEAELWFNSLPDIDALDTIVVFGIGLGYYYSAARDWLKKDRRRWLVFLEDDYSLLKLFFRTEQAAALFEDPQVIILGMDPAFRNEKEGKFLSFDFLYEILISGSSLFTELRSYKSFYGELAELIKNALVYRARQFSWSQLFFRPNFLEMVQKNISRNLIALVDSKLLYTMKRGFKGVPAIICGAGPSLIQDIPALQKYRNRALFFGAGTGMNVLNSSQFFPDFGVGIDPNSESEGRIMTNHAYETPYCYTFSFYYEALEKLHGSKIFFKGGTTYGIGKWLSKKFGLEQWKKLDYKVSTSSACLAIAKELGCNLIILMGMDLAYSEKRKYPKGVRVHHTISEKKQSTIKLNSRDNFLNAPGKDGTLLLTRADWMLEAYCHQLFAAENPEINFINCTSKGLSIPKVPDESFEEIAPKYLKYSMDIDNLIHTEIQAYPNLNITIEKIKSAAAEWMGYLDDCIKVLEEIVNEFEKIAKAWNSGDFTIATFRTASYNALKKKFKNLEIYRYFLKNFEHSYKIIFFPDYYLFTYRKDLLTEHQIRIEELQFELGRVYYLHSFIQILKKNYSYILERPDSNVEAKQIETKERVRDGGYLFENDRLMIKDKECELDWNERFSPEKIEGAGQPQKEGVFTFASFENGIPDGQCLVYYPDGKIKAEWFYKEGKMHGPASFYSPGGDLLARGWFLDDSRQGKNFQYYLQGELCSLKRYKNNLFHGNQEYYYQSGVLKSMIPYNEGRLEGAVRLYYPNGRLKREMHFASGVIEGKETYWSGNGELLLEADYREGKPIGMFRMWYPGGQLKMEKKYYSPENYDVKSWSEEGILIESKNHASEEFDLKFPSKSEEVRARLKKITGLLGNHKSGRSE